MPFEGDGGTRNRKDVILTVIERFIDGRREDQAVISVGKCDIMCLGIYNQISMISFYTRTFHFVRVSMCVCPPLLVYMESCINRSTYSPLW